MGRTGLSAASTMTVDDPPQDESDAEAGEVAQASDAAAEALAAG
jgi:hypothetical protein